MSENNCKAAKPSRLKTFRNLSQLTFLGILGQWSFYAIFRCPFPVPFINCATCPVITCWGRITSLFWGFWLILPLSVILFGRAFCGWACPGGLASRLIVKLSPLKKRLYNYVTRVAPWGMVLGVAVTLFLWLGLDNPRWAVPIRVGGFFESVGLTFEHANIYWLTRTLTVLGLFLLGLTGANLWCSWACPSGGVLEAVRRFSFFRIYKNSKCNDCNVCQKVCDMKTRPDEINCTNCGDCVEVCPQNAIIIGRKGSEAVTLDEEEEFEERKKCA